MLLQRLCLVLFFIIYRPIHWSYVLMFIILRPIIKLTISNCITNNNWSESKNNYTKIVGKVIGSVHKVYNQTHNKILNTYNKVKDDEVIKSIVNLFNIIRNKIYEYDLYLDNYVRNKIFELYNRTSENLI